MPDNNTHYGDLLKKEIEDKGYQITRIAEKLRISYRTLMARIEDGEFTIQEIETLQTNRYLPADIE